MLLSVTVLRIHRIITVCWRKNSTLKHIKGPRLQPPEYVELPVSILIWVIWHNKPLHCFKRMLTSWVVYTHTNHSVEKYHMVTESVAGAVHCIMTQDAFIMNQ